jgi:hypothetical protein
MEPILYLPKYSYFGDYQILFKLKSNIEFRTFDPAVLLSKQTSQKLDHLPDVIFMCIKDDKFDELCSLFP